LDKIRDAFQRHPQLPNLLVDDAFIAELRDRLDDWRQVVSAAVGAGISLPAMSASLAYFEALRRDVLPANLIQAQRDFFGAHTYKRKDRDGAFHTAWPS
ncbi:MAG: NADP-dependent phosphogluconate dehydrogenase, partial [Calditrichaeota bacterium]